MKANMEKKHRICEDRYEGFTDDWPAMATEVQRQPSSQPPMWDSTDAQSTVDSATLYCTPLWRHSQTSRNLYIGTLACALDNRNDLQETVVSLDVSQAPSTRFVTFLDSHVRMPDGSQLVAE